MFRVLVITLSVTLTAGEAITNMTPTLELPASLTAGAGTLTLKLKTDATATNVSYFDIVGTADTYDLSGVKAADVTISKRGSDCSATDKVDAVAKDTEATTAGYLAKQSTDASTQTIKVVANGDSPAVLKASSCFHIEIANVKFGKNACAAGGLTLKGAKTDGTAIDAKTLGAATYDAGICAQCEDKYIKATPDAFAANHSCVCDNKTTKATTSVFCTGTGVSCNKTTGTNGTDDAADVYQCKAKSEDAAESSSSMVGMASITCLVIASLRRFV